MDIQETQELVKNAQGKEYSNFKEQALEMLKQKAAEKLAEKGYFDRLEHAKGIFEGENPFDKKDDKDSDDKDDKDDKDSDNKDDKDDKDSDDKDDKDK